MPSIAARNAGVNALRKQIIAMVPDEFQDMVAQYITDAKLLAAADAVVAAEQAVDGPMTRPTPAQAS